MPAGQPGTIRFGMTSSADGSARIDRFDVIAGDMEAIGKLDFEGGNFRRWKADISKFKVGKTDIRGQVSQLSDREFLVRLDGSRLDIEQLLIGDQRESREVTRNAVTETKQIYIDMNVDSLRTDQGLALVARRGRCVSSVERSICCLWTQAWATVSLFKSITHLVKRDML